MQIDVSAIAKFLREFAYRGPFQGTFEYVSSELIRNDRHYKSQVLFFDQRTEQGLNEIHTDYDETELSELLKKIKDPIAEILTCALKEAGFQLAPAIKPVEQLKSNVLSNIEKSIVKPVILQNTTPKISQRELTEKLKLFLETGV